MFHRCCWLGSPARTRGSRPAPGAPGPHPGGYRRTRNARAAPGSGGQGRAQGQGRLKGRVRSSRARGQGQSRSFGRLPMTFMSTSRNRSMFAAKTRNTSA
jgi:hypothetical protein